MRPFSVFVDAEEEEDSEEEDEDEEESAVGAETIEDFSSELALENESSGEAGVSSDTSMDCTPVLLLLKQRHASEEMQEGGSN